MSKAARTVGQAAPRRSWFWVQGAIAGGAAAALPGLALTLGVLLCPALAFYVSEKAAGRPVSRAMLLCGSTAVFHPLRTLWDHDGSLAAALDILSDPSRPLLAWLACGSGWLLCEITQMATRLVSQARTRSQIHALKQEQSGLIGEWSAADAP